MTLEALEEEEEEVGLEEVAGTMEGVEGVAGVAGVAEVEEEGGRED